MKTTTVRGPLWSYLSQRFPTISYEQWRAAAKAELGRRDFGVWLGQVSPTWHWRWQHLEHIRAQLDRVTRGEIDRLMLFLPPRHGKSEQVTIRYPVWRLEREPTMQVIVAAYNQLLANTFSRKARRIAEERLTLSDDRAAVDDWETAQGGRFRAVGVGSGVTGQGGDLIIIDDPVKSREEAASETYRERVWGWYREDLYTRLAPSAAMILIMCMTGDTPVLMADGVERPLGEIRAGDKVGTYDGGQLGTAMVQRHVSQGMDVVYRITTVSGRTVRANARHPFLVEEHGVQKWVELRHLTAGHKIVCLGDTGRARRAPWKDAMSLLAVGATAPRTITKRDGRRGFARHPITRRRAEKHDSSIATVSAPMNMMPCLRHKAESVLSVVSQRGTTCERTGAENCAWTTVTKPAQSGGFCATIATLPSDMPRQKQRHSLWSNTSGFTTEAIAKIEPAGVEEVFDVQIERTENFIANGLVSHNTRWHEDDLAGRILASDDAPSWEVVKLPALAEEGDPLGRDVGAALCPERFDEAALERIRGVLGARSFWALYQQAPQPAEGDLIKRHWLDIVDGEPAAAQRVRYWDFAATEGGGAFTAGVLLAHARGVYYVCDVKRGQWSTGQREQIMRQTAELDRQAQACDVAVWFEQEPGSSGVDAMHATIRAMTGFNVRADRATGSKDTRLMPFAAQAEAGNVKLVRGSWNEAFLDELTSVPNGKYRDQADAVAGAFNQLARQSRGYSVYNY